MLKFNTTAMIVTSASLLALGACSSNAPEDLPPPPVGTDTGQTDTFDPNAVRPGSRADFVAQAGSDTVYFETDSYGLDTQSRSILDAQARWLVANPSVTATIEGHADERGTREYNLALGERRANAAKNYLAARGVDAGRMTVISYGKERPVALGSNEGSWSQNRRAVTVVPVG